MVAGDDIHTTDELIRCRARELKNATLIGYPKEGVADYEEHSAHAIDRYVDAAAEILQQRGLTPVVSLADIETTIRLLTPIHRTETLRKPLLLGS
jgi:hypothetical protein